MPDKNTEKADLETDFFEVRCKLCDSFLFELATGDDNSDSVVRIKCRKCKRLAKVRLSPELKQNSIYQRVAEQFLHHA